MSKHFKKTPFHSFIAPLSVLCFNSDAVSLDCDRGPRPSLFLSPILVHTMGEEKARVSGENSRPADSPVLPTVNPASEKPAPKSGGLHASVYVMSAPAISEFFE